jgi:hypothetical protein
MVAESALLFGLHMPDPLCLHFGQIIRPVCLGFLFLSCLDVREGLNESHTDWMSAEYMHLLGLSTY